MCEVSAKTKPKRLWCVEFWDRDRWDEYAGTRRPTQAQCVALAQQMNREQNPQAAMSPFGGHRFRVRRAKES